MTETKDFGIIRRKNASGWIGAAMREYILHLGEEALV